MPNYIIAYHGELKKPQNPEEANSQMTRWRAWIGGLGNAIVNPGSPLGMSAIVSSSGVAEDNWPNKMSGFSIVKADDFHSALDIAKACPYLEIGGTLRVAELMEMRPR